MVEMGWVHAPDAVNGMLQHRYYGFSNGGGWVDYRGTISDISLSLSLSLLGYGNHQAEGRRTLCPRVHRTLGSAV